MGGGGGGVVWWGVLGFFVLGWDMVLYASFALRELMGGVFGGGEGGTGLWVLDWPCVLLVEIELSCNASSRRAVATLPDSHHCCPWASSASAVNSRSLVLSRLHLKGQVSKAPRQKQRGSWVAYRFLRTPKLL